MRLKPTAQNYFFHPYEITFSGYSNSGKTTLISKLVKELSPELNIGYFKHDAHKFTMDHEHKDTWILNQAGAKSIFINDPHHLALLKDGEVDQISIRDYFLDIDCLFIEGHKYSKLPKLVITNNENQEQVINDIKTGKIQGVLAFIGENTTSPFPDDIPYFNRNDLNHIKSFILKYLKNKIPSNINGLILTGGRSLRMKQDKGSLEYHGESQISHTAKLLAPFCNSVFVSCREEQKNLPSLDGLSTINDSFPGAGPSIGILSAQIRFRDSAWLVVGCDLPYLNKQTIAKLIENRSPFKLATCFLNPTRKWPEPLCTIYEPNSYHKLFKYLAFDNPCPRKMLFNSNIKAIELEHKLALENVNTPEQKEAAITYLKQNGALYENQY